MGARTRGKARTVSERPPAPQGWSTTDEDEIALRRWRGSTAIAEIEGLEPEHPVFGTFRVHSDAGSAYEVEIRSLDQHTNSCGCIDHRVNGLGTCKHIEGVLATQESKYIMLNAPEAALAQISALLPGAEAPTILPLSGRPGHVAVHAVCKESVFWETLQQLKGAGASAILVVPIEKMML